MSGDIKDDINDINDDKSKDSVITEYREETWGKNVEGEYVTDGFKFRGKQPFKKAKEELENLFVRGAQFEVGNIQLKILDSRDRGIEREVVSSGGTLYTVVSVCPRFFLSKRPRAHIA